jgi:hypothetical protein
MEDLITKFGDYGVLGIVAGILFFQTYSLQKKLLEIIEKNTKAFEELRAIIDKCQIMHKDQ